MLFLKGISIIIFSNFFILPALASEIDTALFCTVQAIEDISILTNTSDSVHIEKTTPSKEIKVIYKPGPNGSLLESYGVKSEIESITEYRKAYSSGGTQYIGVKDPNQAITYFGKIDDKYHAIIKFIRVLSNEGSTYGGFRADNFMKISIACVDKDILNSQGK